MTGTPAVLAGLLAECEAHGIRLALAGDGGMAIDAPQEALTPELLDQLKAHKADLLGMLLQGDDHKSPHNPTPKRKAPTPAVPVCRCGSFTWRDMPIHDGQSIRRDCGRCGRFLNFPVWYGHKAIVDY